MKLSEKYPCYNTSLKNIKNEQWREIPYTEGYYLISNLGRVKALPRYIEVYIPSKMITITSWTKEKILKTKIKEKWNSIAHKPYFECAISICMGGKAKTYRIARLVYTAFIKEIDFESDGLMIMHKDGDGLNNYYTNLVAGNRSAVTKKSYDSKRHKSPFALKSKKEMKGIRARGVTTRQKPVTQYSLRGKKIQDFKSIKEASDRTGISGSNIVSMLKGINKSAGGFLWKYKRKLSNARA